MRTTGPARVDVGAWPGHGNSSSSSSSRGGSQAQWPGRSPKIINVRRSLSLPSPRVGVQSTQQQQQQQQQQVHHQQAQQAQQAQQQVNHLQAQQAQQAQQQVLERLMVPHVQQGCMRQQQWQRLSNHHHYQQQQQQQQQQWLREQQARQQGLFGHSTKALCVPWQLAQSQHPGLLTQQAPISTRPQVVQPGTQEAAATAAAERDPRHHLSASGTRVGRLRAEVRAFAHVHASMHSCTRACVCMCVCAFVSVYIYVYIHVYTYVYTYVCVYMCVYTCVYVQICSIYNTTYMHDLCARHPYCDTLYTEPLYLSVLCRWYSCAPPGPQVLCSPPHLVCLRSLSPNLHKLDNWLHKFIIKTNQSMSDSWRASGRVHFQSTSSSSLSHNQSEAAP